MVNCYRKPSASVLYTKSRAIILRCFGIAALILSLYHVETSGHFCIRNYQKFKFRCTWNCLPLPFWFVYNDRIGESKAVFDCATRKEYLSWVWKRQGARSDFFQNRKINGNIYQSNLRLFRIFYGIAVCDLEIVDKRDCTEENHRPKVRIICSFHWRVLSDFKHSPILIINIIHYTHICHCFCGVVPLVDLHIVRRYYATSKCCLTEMTRCFDISSVSLCTENTFASYCLH